jgi:hypothetical protein
MEKTREDNQKARKIGRIVNQMSAFGPEHYKIRTQWASNILSKNMLERV